jgi:sigma-B regulation protein RsbU (phosphoserine phosphatase)
VQVRVAAPRRLGDVSGKGVGAAVLMASAQSYLRASSEHVDDPAALLEKLNAHVLGRSGSGTFVTMLVVIVDGAADTLHIADAGHAHWCLARPGEPARVVEIERTMPVGVVESLACPIARLPFAAGSRLIVFSDGLVEQMDADGHQFGMDRVLEVLEISSSVDADITQLHEALRTHAGGSSFADDLTIGSFERI